MSRCLGFAAVRYDGKMLEGRFVDALREDVDFLTVCPEIGIGLGVPRDPIRLVRDDGGTRLFQPSTGRDLAREMKEYSERILAPDALADRLDGAVLKSRSPSCGLGDAKLYDGPYDTIHAGRDSGLFAGALRSRLPWVGVTDEESLKHGRRRSRFLVHVWILATLRSIASRGDAVMLLRFHESHRPLLRAVGEEENLRAILERARGESTQRRGNADETGDPGAGGAGAEAEGSPVRRRVEAYRRALGTALARSGPGPILEQAGVLPTLLRGNGSWL